MTTITVRIPDDLKKELDMLSKIEHKPLSDLARDSLRKYLAIHKFRYIRNQILPFAEAEGILTDEDVLK